MACTIIHVTLYTKGLINNKKTIIFDINILFQLFVEIRFIGIVEDVFRDK